MQKRNQAQPNKEEDTKKRKGPQKESKPRKRIATGVEEPAAASLLSTSR